MWMTWLMTRLDMTILVHLCCFWCACQAVVLLGDGCPHDVSQIHLHLARCVEYSMAIRFARCCIFTLLLACMLACLTSSSIRKKYMSSCSVAGWRMSSWYVTASPPPGKVHGVFDDHWIFLMLHSHVAPYLYVGMLDRFIHSQKVHVRLPICLWTHLCIFLRQYVHEHIFASSFVHENIFLHASFVRLLANLSFYMYSLCSSHPSSRHVCLCTCICNHSWQNDIKFIKLVVYHDAWSF